MNAFERFEAKVEKPNAFERFEKANAPKLNAFERSAFDDGDPVYDPMAAVGLAWGQYEDLQQRYPSLLSGEIAQIAADAKYKGKAGFGEEMRGLTLKEFIPGAELADLSEDSPLVRYSCRKYPIESTNAVTGDHQVVFSQIINISNFTLTHECCHGILPRN